MTEPRRMSYAELRSARWHGATDLRSFGHRLRTKQMGFASRATQRHGSSSKPFAR